MSGPKRPSTVYFARHGECQANLIHINLPPQQDGLTEKGKAQSVLLGEHLKDVKFTKVYSSTYPRAYDTANQVLKNSNACKELQLIQDARLRERDVGIYENRTLKELFDKVLDDCENHGALLLEYDIPGGERAVDIQERIGSFLQDLLKEIRESEEPQTILIVFHGQLLILLMYKLYQWSQDSAKALKLKSWSADLVTGHMKNTGYHLLSFDVPKEGNAIIDFVKTNQFSHLNSLQSQPSESQSTPQPTTKEMVEYVHFVQRFGNISKSQCATQ